MGDGAEGLVDAQSRIQDRIDELEERRRIARDVHDLVVGFYREIVFDDLLAQRQVFLLFDSGLEVELVGFFVGLGPAMHSPRATASSLSRSDRTESDESLTGAGSGSGVAMRTGPAITSPEPPAASATASSSASMAGSAVQKPG